MLMGRIKRAWPVSAASRLRCDLLQDDLNRKFLLPAAQDHTAQRRDVCEVAPPAEDHMLVTHHDAIGGIEINPAVLGTQPATNPCMRLVSPKPRKLRPRRPCADVAGDIAGWQ